MHRTCALPVRCSPKKDILNINAPVQRQRIVQVVQNQFVPPSDNVEALYLELQRCLLYDGIVLDLEEKVARVREAIKQLEPYDEGNVEHRVQCVIQGLSWIILESNMLNSVTRIEYGGKATFENMQQPCSGVSKLDETPWTYPTLQHHLCNALCNTVEQQEHFRNSMPAVYGMLTQRGLAFPRTCHVPMDLFRKEHKLGMFQVPQGCQVDQA